MTNIQVIFEKDDFLVVKTTRGVGPRALDLRFPTLSLRTICYAAYAQNIILYAKIELSDIRVTAYCLVKGVPSNQTVSIDGYSTNIQVIQTVPSNALGHISLIQVTTISYPLLPRQLRRHLASVGHPVLGNVKECQPFKGQGLCIAVTRLQFKDNETDYDFTLDVPNKFYKILEKEQKHYKGSIYGDGTAEFGDLTFCVNQHVMVPRKGSLQVVDTTLERMKSMDLREPTILDLGTGSGCLLLYLLTKLESKARGIGVDISPEALKLAGMNAQALNVGDQCEWVEGSFESFPSLLQTLPDAVVCNPPYHMKRGRNPIDDTGEPDHALFVQDSDPLKHYRDVVDNLVQMLKGKDHALVLVFEVFRDNGSKVVKLLEDSGGQWRDFELERDSRGDIRTVSCIWGTKTAV